MKTSQLGTYFSEQFPKRAKAAELRKYPRVVVTEFEMKSSGFIGGKREDKREKINGSRGKSNFSSTRIRVNHP